MRARAHVQAASFRPTDQPQHPPTHRRHQAHTTCMVRKAPRCVVIAPLTRPPHRTFSDGMTWPPNSAGSPPCRAAAAEQQRRTVPPGVQMASAHFPTGPFTPRHFFSVRRQVAPPTAGRGRCATLWGPPMWKRTRARVPAPRLANQPSKTRAITRVSCATPMVTAKVRRTCACETPRCVGAPMMHGMAPMPMMGLSRPQPGLDRQRTPY